MTPAPEAAARILRRRGPIDLPTGVLDLEPHLHALGLRRDVGDDRGVQSIFCAICTRTFNDRAQGALHSHRTGHVVVVRTTWTELYQPRLRSVQ